MANTSISSVVEFHSKRQALRAYVIWASLAASCGARSACFVPFQILTCGTHCLKVTTLFFWLADIVVERGLFFGISTVGKVI